MLLWLVYLPFSLLFSAICYITNPLLVLFCDEDGELPGILHLWQTWDNSCNPSDVQTIFPAWMQFDFSEHYLEHRGTTPRLEAVNRERWFTLCVNPDFTLAERLKRYLCRVLWLTRNNAYGFSFWLLGADTRPLWERVIDEPDRSFVRELCGGNVAGAWRYIDKRRIFSAFGYAVRWNILLGWKVDTDARRESRAMIANRIAFKINKEG